jgi:hypothetical protein
MGCATVVVTLGLGAPAFMHFREATPVVGLIST